ncbi:MAG: PEGA domain-containing protein [Gemmataceae bacterium]
MKPIWGVNPLIVVLGLLATSTGCATVVSRGGRDQNVTISADTPGATVLVDGQPSGTTPATVPLSRKSDHTVEVVAPGYETAHLTVRRRFNPWVFGNLIIGGPIGLVIDIVSDSTHTLSPDELKVNLKPLPTGSAPVPAPVSNSVIPTGAVRPQ